MDDRRNANMCVRIPLSKDNGDVLKIVDINSHSMV